MKTIRESYPDGTLPPQNLIHLSCRWNKAFKTIRWLYYGAKENSPMFNNIQNSIVINISFF